MKPCFYCEQRESCPAADREDMVATWCPYYDGDHGNENIGTLDGNINTELPF